MAIITTRQFRYFLGFLCVVVMACTILSYALTIIIVITSKSDSRQYIFSLRRHNTSFRVMPNIVMSESDWENLMLLERLNTIENATSHVSRDTKVILWYVPTRHLPVMSELHRMRHCPQSKCRVTTNRDFYNQSDALIFTAQLISQVPVPPRKLPNQVWILHNHESPHYWGQTLSLYDKVWKSKFNWTLDYRHDADIVSPYGRFLRDSHGKFKQISPLKKNYSRIASVKTGSVAWMVSNCETMSRRMEYVEELRKHGVQVDIFGGCGSKHCQRADDQSCLDEISKKYKFYLAFENAFCKDYITEKFFRYFKADILLIVRGGGDYSKEAPAQTYINAEDYACPKQLAAYINKLENNNEEYIKQLKIKDQYEVVYEEWPIVQNGAIAYMEYHDDATPMCELCDRLWNADKHKKLYKDIAKWFKKGLCYQPKNLTTIC